MQKYIWILTLMCASVVMQAQDKKVAMLETIGMTEDVSAMVKSMVRGELTKSICLEEGYSAFSRTDIDQMMKEVSFQTSGMVNDEQIAELGLMSGADYVCISKVSQEDQSYYIETFLIEIESGRIENPATAFIENGNLKVVNAACKRIAKELLGLTLETQIKEEEICKVFVYNIGIGGSGYSDDIYIVYADNVEFGRFHVKDYLVIPVFKIGQMDIKIKNIHASKDRKGEESSLIFSRKLQIIEDENIYIQTKGRLQRNVLLVDENSIHKKFKFLLEE